MLWVTSFFPCSLLVNKVYCIVRKLLVSHQTKDTLSTGFPHTASSNRDFFSQIAAQSKKECQKHVQEVCPRTVREYNHCFRFDSSKSTICRYFFQIIVHRMMLQLYYKVVEFTNTGLNKVISRSLNHEFSSTTLL